MYPVVMLILMNVFIVNKQEEEIWRCVRTPPHHHIDDPILPRIIRIIPFLCKTIGLTPTQGRRKSWNTHKRKICQIAARDHHAVHSILPSPDPG
jgi:hypothetical protein